MDSKCFFFSVFFFTRKSFHFGMHMTCPAHYQSCLWERERERERQCEDSDALYKSCNKKISQYRWKTVFRRKIWKSVCVCFSFHKNKTKEHRLVWIKSEVDGNERIYRWRTALSVVKASSWHCCITGTPIPSFVWAPPNPSPERRVQNTCRHANTTWEGSTGSLALCRQSRIHKGVK